MRFWSVRPARRAGAVWPVLLIALAVRLLPLPMALSLAPKAAAGGLGSDGARYYLPLARSLSECGEFALEPGRPAFRHAPLYPLLLAGLHVLGLSSQAWRMAAQALLGSLALALLFVWVRDTLGVRAAWIALALASALPDFLVYSYLDLSENLAIVLTLAALLLFERARGSSRAAAWALAGAFVGLAALTREFCVTLLAPLALAALQGSGNPRREARGLVLMALAAFATVLPWTLRNVRASGEPILLTEKAGWNAYVGTLVGEHPPSDSRWSWSPGRPAQRERHRRLLLALAAETSPGARDRLCWRAARENVAEDPGGQLVHLLRKSGFFWRPNVGTRHAGRLGLRPLLIVSEILYGACLAAAAAAAFTRRGRERRCRIFWLLIAWTLAVHLALGSAEPRYHFLLLPAVFALAAASLSPPSPGHDRQPEGGR